MSQIIIRNAREHNLDSVDLTLPGSRFICFTGVSGSGKSSLAFDTLYAEGQRRYVECLSSYARQFIGQLPKPKVDQVLGLSPAISISQKTAGQNSRSTVGTITEISDFLRVLYARVGVGYCPKCGRKIVAQTKSQILEHIKVIPSGSILTILAPLIRNQKGRCAELLSSMRKKGYRRVRVDGVFYSLDSDLNLDKQARHSIDVVVDSFEQADSNYRRVVDAVDAALQLAKGRMLVIVRRNERKNDPIPDIRAENAPLFGDFNLFDDESTRSSRGVRQRKVALKSSVKEDTIASKEEEIYFSADYACSHCGVSFDRPSPQMFSFNSNQGMCRHCQGMGFVHTFDPTLLIPDPTKSFQQGCIVPVGKWQDLGRWRQHIYQGAAAAIAKRYSLEPNSILETAWEELDSRVVHDLLWGTDNLSVTYLWRNGSVDHKWNGVFEGIIPKMLKQYEETTNKMQIEAMERYMSVVPCAYCGGLRLNEQARSVLIETTSNADAFKAKKALSLPEVSNLPISDLIEFFSGLNLNPTTQIIANELVKEIRTRLGFLLDVGLNYLSLGRPAPTLSGGEMQRIRLAGQIGGGLVGALYVLDEPSIGLHTRDNEKLIRTLARLRDLGNTVVVVEHDEDTMLASDFMVDFGPGPGAHGGRVVASGPVSDVLANQRSDSLTARFIAGEESIPVPTERKKPDGRWLVVKGARRHNLKNIDVRIPLGGVVCVTGVSGSGKSSLVNDILREALAVELNHASGCCGEYDSIEGLEHLKKLISIDQAPIGRTPRSNPATYIKLFDDIRKLFSETPEARAKGFTPGRFSFNVAGGRCEACEGNGATRMEMDFLPDVWATCPVCGGRRFNLETTAIKYKGLSIDQALDLDVESALKHFEHIPKIREKLQTLYDVGLGYMKLGQPSPTLSGGEAQRVKLAKELVKKSAGKTIYLLDEPTTGLHFADVRALLKVLRSFADAGNTVLIVEHNLDVVKTADWVIDLGPEGGEEGGRVVAEGTPEEIAENPESRTGQALKEFLYRDRKAMTRKIVQRGKKRKADNVPESSPLDEPIIIRGAREHNLQNVSVEIPRNKMTVCCGPSGSGKSSLAIDVAYAEGRRRYVESLSSYARQFLGQIQKPDVEQTLGISPSIAIEQKTTSRSPRSTVGTVTEILDYLRVVFARLGEPYCPDCNLPIGSQTTDEIIARIALLGREEECKILIDAPLALEKDEDYSNMWERLRAQGFSRVRVDDVVYQIDDAPDISRKSVHNVEAVVDRLVMKPTPDAQTRKTIRGRIASDVETALNWGKGELCVVIVDDNLPPTQWRVQKMSLKRSCEKCGRAFDVLTPQHFSFNSQLGCCPHCEGLGTQRGSNTKNFITDSKLTLVEGAVALWSDFNDPMTTATLRAFARGLQAPLETPFERLDARFRRAIFSGTGERWFEVYQRDLDVGRSAKNPRDRAKGACEYLDSKHPGGNVVLRFQFKGVYPAIEEAGRLAPYYRSRLEFQIEECECSSCLGSRLRDDVAAVRFHSQTLDQICRSPLSELAKFFENLQLTPLEEETAGDLIREIIARLRFLIDVGLGYLTLSRPSPSLSGGESQRIRLAAQIGGGLVGVLYVLDEPTIGLHQRDNARLIAAMKRLRDLGNTLLVVEHDQEVLESADHLIDFGPKAGSQGGLIVAEGTAEELKKNENSVTGAYLSGKKTIPIPVNRRIIP